MLEGERVKKNLFRKSFVYVTSTFSLISKQYVLTGEKNIGEQYELTLWKLSAAHCVVNTGRYKLVSVKVGEYRLSTRLDCDEYSDSCEEKQNDKEYLIENAKYHEDYNSITSYNDIALIRLQRKVKFDRLAKPICLPWSQPENNENLIYTATGESTWSIFQTDFSHKFFRLSFKVGVSEVFSGVELPWCWLKLSKTRKN